MKYKYIDGDIKGTKIECCAILYFGVCYIIPAPATHQDVAEYIEHWLKSPYDESKAELGFLTDKSEFLTLTEGFIFASERGMIIQ